MNFKTVIEFEEMDDHFLPWDLLLDDRNKVTGKSPYAGHTLIGFAPSGALDGTITFMLGDDWRNEVVGLVPVLSDGNFYQLTNHVVRRVRDFEEV